MATFGIRAGRLYPVTGPAIDDGGIVVRDGKIAAVGPASEVLRDVEVVDFSSSVITPGFVDAHAHLGIFEEGMGWEGSDGDETSDTLLFPHLRAIDAINPLDAGFTRALSAGVTTAMVPESSLTVIGGQTLTLKTPPKPVVDDMVIQMPAGLKTALGENPKRENALSRNRYPKTRLGVAGTYREALVAAQNYMAQQEYAQKTGGPAVPRDLGLEALAGLLRGEYPMHMHVHRADDIVTAVRIAREFNVRLVVHHGADADKLAPYLARWGIPVVYGPFLSWRYKREMRDMHPAGVKTCVDAGVKVAITTDYPCVPIEHMIYNVTATMKEGLSAEMALRAITINPAEILGLGSRLGSLEPGKDADLAIFSGDPFGLDTRVEAVYVDGERVWG